MHSDATLVEEYLDELPEDRRAAVSIVRDLVNENLPEGYQEAMGFGMITWGIPLETYPDTYNKQPLQVLALASQKNYMALYLMGIYADEGLEDWFREQYAERGLKLDMGKSCVRFRRLDQLHLEAVAEVVRRVPPQEFIAVYEAARANRR
ncbi:DUF1801 domain-containing protein [Nocardioides donggukensis]|uniref:DUF1801 domain-containing protein n=1 Tax=Nocardioides donggukensis TaxID=2774019 RepID=A0A927K824_9ACTN|nr:DUF1801 domain-containing protein [Nocardioides donggukensis]MBD8870905.1 DUF1801 domain-containing protein [Nocardioides donggukensis]